MLVAVCAWVCVVVYCLLLCFAVCGSVLLNEVLVILINCCCGLFFVVLNFLLAFVLVV